MIHHCHNQGQLQGQTGEESQLTWETFPHTGLIKTYNTDKQAGDVKFNVLQELKNTVIGP